MVTPHDDLILLVDDVPDHVRVVVVHTADAALAAVHQERPSCVVIDERLPDMDGWALCRAFKRDERSKTLPIILLTQEVSRAAAGKSTAAGCSAWMAHPATADDLVRAVDYVLRSDQSSPASSDEALLGVRVCVRRGRRTRHLARRLHPVLLLPQLQLPLAHRRRSVDAAVIAGRAFAG
jgi:DNA-binding response OmpR family regulator